MELKFVMLVTLASFLVLLAVLLLYMQLYKQHVNKALRESNQRSKHMIAPLTLAAFIPVLLIIIGISALCIDLVFDISQSRLTTKEEILENARIGYEDFNSQISMSGDVAAVLSYPDDLSEAEFRVYINHNSNHPDYTFRLGGDLTSIERCAYLLEYNGSFILLSLNVPRIAEIRCENGTTYSIDPDAPFVLVIPDAGSLLSETKDGVTYINNYTGMEVFDENGGIIELTNLQWFEMRYVK